MHRIFRHLATKAYSFPLAGFALLVLLSYLANAVFYSHSAPMANADWQTNSLPWISPATDATVAVREMTARYLIEAAYIVVVVASAGGAIYSLYIASHLWNKASPAHRTAISLLCAFDFALAYIAFVSDWDPFWTSSLPGGLTSKTAELTGFSTFDMWSTTIAVLTITSMVLSGVAVSLQIAVPPVDIQALAAQFGRQKWLLRANAALLVVYSLAAACELLWASSLLPQGENGVAHHVTRLAISVALTGGVVNTLIMAGIHAPALFLLPKRANGIVEYQLPSLSAAERKEFLASHDLATSSYSFLEQSMTILSPLIAGLPLANLTGYFIN